MAMRRIMADVADCQTNLYADAGIYYAADNENAQVGWACVFGPANTPYEDCPMLYEFQLPQGYPFDPPKVYFRTHDGHTRFHPNMYVDGKCCLSILGTWDGPRWSSALRLSSVLVTFQSLMTENPITNEPGYQTYTIEKGRPYAAVVEGACMEYILQRAEEYIQQGSVTGPLHKFVDEWAERLPAICARLDLRLERCIQDRGDECLFQHVPYAMDRKICYVSMLERCKKLRTALHKTPKH
jgi:ubiquitin-protein ligase